MVQFYGKSTSFLKRTHFEAYAENYQMFLENIFSLLNSSNSFTNIFHIFIHQRVNSFILYMTIKIAAYL